MKYKLEKYAKDLRLYYHYGCRRLGLEKHSIHQILSRKHKLLYIPISKNASTSLKHVLFELEEGFAYKYFSKNKQVYRSLHDYFLKQPNAFTGVSDLLSDTSFTKFAVIRDPVKRLISCYRNRVVDLKDLEKSRLDGLPVRPDINYFILKLNKYQKANKIIEHHSRAQHKFLGNTLQYLDHIFPMKQMQRLKDFIKKYQPDYKLLERKSKGTSYALNDLSAEALEKAIHFYQKDYDLLEDYYSADQIWDEYNQASI